MSWVVVALIVVGGLVVMAGIQAAVWVPIVRRTRRIPAALIAECQRTGERIRRGPEQVRYAGANAPGARVQGIAVMVLTDRRLLIRKTVGQQVEIPLAAIAGVDVRRWFRGEYQSGFWFVAITTTAGYEYGVQVRDAASWVSLLPGGHSPSSSP